MTWPTTARASTRTIAIACSSASTRADALGGSGLGLAIARELALRMDGGLHLASRRGRTEFTLQPAGGRAAGARGVSRRATAVAALLAAASLGLAACGGSGRRRVDGDDDGQPAPTGHLPHVAIQTSGGLFNPAAVYDEVSPGVVTIRSIFGQTSARDPRRRRVERRAGLGLRDLLGRRDRHQRPRRHRRARRAAAARSTRRRRCTSSSPIATRSRPRSWASTRSPTSRSCGSIPTASTCTRSRSDPATTVQVGEPVAAIGSPFGEEQSLSTGVVSATDRSIDSLDRLQDRGGDPDGRLDQPRATRAGRCSTRDGRGDRHQPADQHHLGRQRGSRLRRPHRPRASARSTSCATTATVEYAYIGVTTQPLYPQLADRLGLDSDTGALVSDVVDGGPADAPGVRGSDETAPLPGTGGRRRRRRDRRRSTAHADRERVRPAAPHLPLNPGDNVDVDDHPRRRPSDVDVTLGRAPGHPLTGLQRTCRIVGAALRTPCCQEVARCRPSASLADYTHIAGRGLIDEIRELAEPLEGKRVLHVSATAFGGGVSEILYTLVPLMRDVGLDAHWRVILGPGGVLQRHQADAQLAPGRPAGDLRRAVGGVRGLQRDERAGARRRLGRDHRPRSTAGGDCARTRRDASRRWIWRCHIDLSTPNQETLARLLPLIATYDASVWHLQQYVPAGLDGQVSRIVPPAIDPLSPKNMALSPEDAAFVCEQFGIDTDRPLMLPGLAVRSVEGPDRRDRRLPL